MKRSADAGLVLAGTDMVPRTTYPKSQGTMLFDWNGHDLPYDTGQFPPGFYPPNETGYREWIRGLHTTDTFFSRGPYKEFGVGSIWLYVFFAAPVDRRGSGNEDAFYVDLYDYPLGDIGAGRVRAQVQPKVSALPTNTPGFAVFTKYEEAFEVSPGRGYEIRIRALGGCDLELHLLRVFAQLL